MIKVAIIGARVRDMELREKVLKMYPRGRPTPFPWEFSSEPKFEKE